MPFRRARYVRGIVGYPSVLLVVAWVGLWFLWPRVPPALNLPGRVPRPRVVYHAAAGAAASLYVSPVVFALSSRVGFGMPERSTSSPDTAPARMAPSPRFLGWPEAAALYPVMPRDVGGVLGPEERAYHPLWPAPAALAGPATNVVEVVMQSRGALRSAGFSARLPPELVGMSEALWVTEAFVVLDKDGVPEHVFLEKRCQDAKINDAVVRALHRGRAPGATSPVAGRVVISRVRRGVARQGEQE